jgi:ornithine carbamoyltransferase
MNPATILSFPQEKAPVDAPPAGLLSLGGLTGPQLTALVSLSEALDEAPDLYAGELAGRGVACLFLKPSTRTRVSVQVAVHRLGGLPVMLSPEELQLGRGETLADTARILGGYCEAIVARVNGHETVVTLAEHAGVPVINALSDLHHPLQALADLLTLQQRFGQLAGLRLAFVGDGSSNMAHSLAEACALAGMHLTIGAPAGFEPQAAILHASLAAAEANGGSVTLLDDPIAAVEGVDAIYTDTWVSMGQDSEREARLAAFTGFQVDAKLMRKAAPHAVFLHCLPAHRGEEVSADVLDGRRSLVFQQAANRLPTTQAALLAVLRREGGS